MSLKTILTKTLFAAFFITSIFTVNNCFSQNIFRRHVIIAFDNSVAFEGAKDSIQSLLESFLLNQKSGNLRGDRSNLFTDLKKGKPQFDPDRDEISFMQFNDCKTFIKNTNITWSDFKNDRKKIGSEPTIPDFVFNLFNSPKNLSWQSVPNLVFPLVLNYIDKSKFAEEYILINLSSSPIPPSVYTETDLSYLDKITNSNPSFNNIQKELDLLSGQYQKSDYFNDPISNGGIFGYYLSPKNVLPASSQTSITVNTGVNLSQCKYNKDIFDVSGIEFKFPQNELLKPVEVSMTIVNPDAGPDSVLFHDIVASFAVNTWNSSYTGSHKLMRYNKSEFLYSLIGLSLPLENIIKESDCKDLKFYFQIKSNYKVGKDDQLNLLFFANHTVLHSDINFISSKEHAMQFFIPFIIIILFLLLLIFLGRPLGLSYTVMPINESYESNNLKSEGRMNRPYIPWTKENIDLKGQYYRILIYFNVRYRWQNYWFNLRPLFSIGILKSTKPDRFSIYFKENSEAIPEFPDKPYTRIYEPFNDSKEISLFIRQNGEFQEVVDPAKIEVQSYMRISHWSLLKYIELPFEKSVYIGPELHDVWVGIDPGTTGTCFATGRLSGDICMELDEDGKEVIYPSLISFDSEKTKSFKGANKYEFLEYVSKNEDLVLVGSNAEKRIESAGYRIFESIKKLLGYNVEYAISENDQIMLTGSDLSYLMINGLFNQFKKYINANRIKPVINNLFYKGEFNPKRAVVTIPNNFTVKKITDLVKAIENINQFKEIRYIYEAEAVFFSYLADPKYRKKTAERILVFDMGGATINATALDYNFVEGNHRIRILSRIGYSIGGDSIDFFIKEHLFGGNRGAQYPYIGPLIKDPKNFYNDNYARYISFYHGEIKKLKFKIAENWAKKHEELLQKENLDDIFQRFISECNLSEIAKNNYLSRWKKFLNDSDDPEKAIRFINDFKLNENTYRFQSGKDVVNVYDKLYQLVVESIKETMLFSDIEIFDKIIFAGRSTQFPYIREKVLETYNIAKKKDTELIVYDSNALKTAVAKGACWYGLNRLSIELENVKVNASFGVPETTDPLSKDLIFHTIIPAGAPFTFNGSGIPSISRLYPIATNFKHNNNGLIEFFECMGSDPIKDIREGNKEKYHKLSDIRPLSPPKQLEMIVTGHDLVECKVICLNDQSYSAKPEIAELDIETSNNEHYKFWSVLPQKQ